MNGRLSRRTVDLVAFNFKSLKFVGGGPSLSQNSREDLGAPPLCGGGPPSRLGLPPRCRLPQGPFGPWSGDNRSSAPSSPAWRAATGIYSVNLFSCANWHSQHSIQRIHFAFQTIQRFNYSTFQRFFFSTSQLLFSVPPQPKLLSCKSTYLGATQEGSARPTGRAESAGGRAGGRRQGDTSPTKMSCRRANY